LTEIEVITCEPCEKGLTTTQVESSKLQLDIKQERKFAFIKIGLERNGEQNIIKRRRLAGTFFGLGYLKKTVLPTYS